MAGRKKQTSAASGIGCLAILIVVIVAIASQGKSTTTSDATASPASSALAIGGGDTSSSSTDSVSTDSVSTDSGTSTDVAPPPTAPPATPAPTPRLVTATCGAPPNPWGYGFCHGSDFFTVPADFCQYFDCIPSFGDSSGYIVQCRDGEYSNAGGRRGACSSHGGESRALLRP